MRNNKNGELGKHAVVQQLFKSHKTSTILLLIMVAVIKIYSETLLSKKLFHIEQVNWFAKHPIDWFLYETSF